MKKTVRVAYKYRLYPTKAQVRKLLGTLDICRELYNAALDERRSAYRAWQRENEGFSFSQLENGVVLLQQGVTCPDGPRPPFITYVEQANQLPALKEVRPELGEVFSQVLQDVLKRVDKAFKGFFSRIKAGVAAGYPRFRGKGRYASFTYPQAGWSLKNNKLTLSKIGTLKVKLHRAVVGKVKTCTIKREGHNWYVIFSVEYEFDQPEYHAGPPVGIDVGLEYFASLSNEQQIANPRYYRKAQKYLTKFQRKAQKIKSLPKDDPKKIKAIKALRRVYDKVTNQRRDFQHKLSTTLAKTYSLICVEDIKPGNLWRRPKRKVDETNPEHFLPNGASAKAGLSKSIADAGWSTFIAMLNYKVAYTGSKLIKVSPAYTSQLCPNPNCAILKPKTLDERWHSCECGASMPRDIASAKVILRIGLDSLGKQSLDAPAARLGE